MNPGTEVGVGTGVGVAVGLGVGVGVGVEVGVGRGVGVNVGMGVNVGLGVGTGVRVGTAQDATNTRFRSTTTVIDSDVRAAFPGTSPAQPKKAVLHKALTNTTVPSA